MNFINKKIFVQKKNNREECIILGGKRENNEIGFETLKRELIEAVSVDLIGEEFIGGYDDIAVFSNHPIHVQASLATINREIKYNNKIKEV